MYKTLKLHTRHRFFLTAILFSAVIVFGIIATTVIYKQNIVYAILPPIPPSVENNVSGYAWNESVGWISFNCDNTASSCASVDYGVAIDGTTGDFSGYAWSENVGWVSFEPADVAGCPSGTCQPNLAGNNTVSGWAKILSEGADGWVSLSGTSPDYGVTYSSSTNELEGWAWNDTIGWISFNHKGCDADEDGFSDGNVGCPVVGTPIPDYAVVTTVILGIPPSAPTITGPTEGDVDTDYEFGFVATDENLWVQRDVETGSIVEQKQIFTITYDPINNKYVAGGWAGDASGHADAVVWESNDLITWTRRDVDAGALAEYVTSIIYDPINNKYVAGGYQKTLTNTNQDAVVWESTDLITWTRRDVDIRVEHQKISEIIYDSVNNKYVASGLEYNGTDYDAVVWESTDLITWTRRVVDSGLNNQSGGSIVYDSVNNKYVVGGYNNNGTDYDAVVWESTDLITWTQKNVDVGINDQFIKTIIYDSTNNKYITGGYSNNGTDYDAVVWESTDLNIWTKHDVETELNHQKIYEIIYNSVNNKYIAVGHYDYGIGYDAVVWESADLVTWTSTIVGLGSGGYQFINGIVYDSVNNKYAAGGVNNSTGNIATVWELELHDNIRYGIDWDMNGTVDEWVPTDVPIDDYVTSGTQASTTHQWGSTGTTTFQVLTEDDGGLQSGWTQHTITISSDNTLPDAPTITGPTEGDINTDYEFGFVAADSDGGNSDGTYLVNLKSINLGERHTCAISDEDNVYCWGAASTGRLGDDQDTTDRWTPVLVHDGVATGADSDSTYLTNIKNIEVGGYHNCAISNEGNLYSWGYNYNGQLGDDQTTYRFTPVRVHDGEATGADSDGTYLINVKSIKLGEGHTCAVSNEGNAYCWGAASTGRLGDDQDTTDRWTPVLVHDGEATGADSDGTYLINMKSIEPGSSNTCAVSNEGNVYCWGSGQWGKNGNDQTGQYFTPVRVHDGEATGADSDGTYLINIKDIQVGVLHTCAVSNGGNVYCWGKASGGELGDDQTTNRLTPVRVHDGVAIGADSDGTYLTNIESIDVAQGGYHTCAVSNSGNLYSWGQANYGQIGDDQDTTTRFTPVRVHDGVAIGADSDGTYLTNIKSIEKGGHKTCVISNEGNTYCWGDAYAGQIGDDQDTTNRLTPVRVHDGVAIDTFSLDNLRYGIDWDMNGTVDEWVPTDVPIDDYVTSGTQASSTRQWSATGTTTFQVLAEDDGGLQSDWTQHTIIISNNTPPDIPTITGTTTGDINTDHEFGFVATDNDGADSDGTYLTNMKSIKANYYHTCALSSEGNAYCWGLAGSGRLGDDQITTDRLTPVRVHDGAAIGADSNGTYLTNIKSIEAGLYHTCAISNDDNVYCWGHAGNGALGDDQTTDRLTPIRVHDGAATGADSNGTYLTNIKSIETGHDHTCAVSNSGNAYCWGYADWGKLGDDQTTINRFTPIRVHDGAATGADSDGTYLINIKSIVAGAYHTCAISNDDNVYCWGHAEYGQLGDDQTAKRLTPVRVHDGAATGADSNGTYLTNIKSIKAGLYHTCVISNANNVYCWGDAGNGALGDDQTANRLTPVRVHDGAATGADSNGTYLINIKSIIAGYAHTCAISNDNNVYCWGWAAQGQLGDDQIATDRFTPIRVHDGAATGADSNGTYLINIKSIDAGVYHTCAISNDDNVYCWGHAGNGALGDDQTTDRLTPVRVHDGAAVDVFSPDNLRYGIDWTDDATDSVEEWLPTDIPVDDYVLSSTTQSTTTRWSTTGDKTFKALAEDDSGLRSAGWTSHTITITAAGNPPTAGITSPTTGDYSQGASIPFAGWGSDTLPGSVVAAEWRDYGASAVGDCDAGTLMSTAWSDPNSSFSTSTLSLNDHNICFRVQDDDNMWSEVTASHVRVVTIISTSQCSDSGDNDSDGYIDNEAGNEDPACYDVSSSTNPIYHSEYNDESADPQCSNKIDDDSDGLIDIDDPGCHSDGDPTNAGSYNKFDNDENNCGSGVCEIGETYVICPLDCPFLWIEF